MLTLISEGRAWSQYALKRVRKSRPLGLNRKTRLRAGIAQGDLTQFSHFDGWFYMREKYDVWRECVRKGSYA